MAFVQLLKNASTAAEVARGKRAFIQCWGTSVSPATVEIGMEGSLYAPAISLLGTYPREVTLHMCFAAPFTRGKMWGPPMHRTRGAYPQWNTSPKEE